MEKKIERAREKMSLKKSVSCFFRAPPAAGGMLMPDVNYLA